MWVYFYADFFSINIVGPSFSRVLHQQIQPTADKNSIFRILNCGSPTVDSQPLTENTFLMRIIESANTKLLGTKIWL